MLAIPTLAHLTPTQLEAAERRRKFRAAIASKAADLADRQTCAALSAIRVAAVEAPLAREPQLAPASEDVIPSPPSISPYWFAILATEPSDVRYPSILEIQKTVAKHFGLKVSDLISSRRTADITLPRQIAVYLCKELTPHSYPQIGRRFGHRDHTTQIHSFKKIRAMIVRDAGFAIEVAGLVDALGSQQ